MVQEITNLDQFKQVINSGKPVMIDFWATWCGPCLQIGPEFKRLSEDPQYAGVEFYKVDVDAVPDVAQECGIRAMPTFHLYKDGEKQKDMIGANKVGLVALAGEANLLA